MTTLLSLVINNLSTQLPSLHNFSTPPHIEENTHQKPRLITTYQIKT